jgi:hypothetical protein
VWTGDGQEISERFRTGKDSWPVGHHLFGLNVWEFEKCALVRPGRAGVGGAPGREGTPFSTLHARLESAADTSVGDTNASEAVQVLEARRRPTTAVELGSTMKGRDLRSSGSRRSARGCRARWRALEKDFAKLAAPFEKLMRPRREGRPGAIGAGEDRQRAA